MTDIWGKVDLAREIFISNISVTIQMKKKFMIINVAKLQYCGNCNNSNFLPIPWSSRSFCTEDLLEGSFIFLFKNSVISFLVISLQSIIDLLSTSFPCPEISRDYRANIVSRPLTGLPDPGDSGFHDER